ncbi:MAG: bifunctional DNA primase/polymerase [Acidimicrobiaceae bacterium]|nr:bifunctional DNA primase/polymerase [Acidimicrobiaceae bacterium]
MSAEHESAVRAASRGWRVFPVMEGGKRPLVRWQDEATTDPDRLRYWWSGPWYHANVGCVVPPGVVVLDVDPRHDGDVSLERLEDSNGTLPTTLTTVTGSGGWHLWFRYVDADELRQDANVLPGIDTRCAGRGFVVLPPSVHPCGGRYHWARGPKTIVDAPAWLVGLLRKPSRGEQRPIPGPTGDSGESLTLDQARYALAALRSETAAVAAAPVGERNHQLNRSAFAMRRLTSAGCLDPVRAAVTLAGAAMAAGLEGDETVATIASGLGIAREEVRSWITR